MAASPHHQLPALAWSMSRFPARTLALLFLALAMKSSTVSNKGVLTCSDHILEHVQHALAVKRLLLRPKWI